MAAEDREAIVMYFIIFPCLIHIFLALSLLLVILGATDCLLPNTFLCRRFDCVILNGSHDTYLKRNA